MPSSLIGVLVAARTFDALRDADLEQVYQQGREAVMRDHAFRILLARADSVAKLEQLTFAGEIGLDHWTTKELIELFNHFRLLSSPENQIRLYQQCEDAAFRSAPRVREFYMLALNKVGRPAEAIQEASRLMAEGGQNGLVWGTLGESYAARLRCAAQVAQALETSDGDRSLLDPELIVEFHRCFPEIDGNDLNVVLARVLRAENLESATHIFRRGFRESGSSYTGLGWLLGTNDQLTDLIVERGHLAQKQQTSGLTVDEAVRLHLADDKIQKLENSVTNQARLIELALDLQGGSKSLDYWTHAGQLLLTVIQAGASTELDAVLGRMFATADASFKFTITLAELRNLREQYIVMRKLAQAQQSDPARLALRIDQAAIAIAALEAGRVRFEANGSALNPADRQALASELNDAVTIFLRKTVNFRTLTSNLTPLHIGGNIGRVGARVPDLLINRQVQADLADLVETKIIQALMPEDKANPKAVIARIQQIVGAGFRVGELQDLQSPAHFAFDVRSDGLIALSGIDQDMRKNTRTGTDLTATLLMQNGDCRETMYLNGALFACWQQVRVKEKIAKAVLCLELGFDEGFQKIVTEEIPELMRYQLRGGQFAVYVEAIAVHTKYNCERVSAHDATAVLRIYGLSELRAGQPLTQYELENSLIEVTYTDDTTLWLEPKDPVTGKRCPLVHMPTPDGGVPLIANAGATYENLKALRLLNLVEDHALTLLYDRQAETMEFCDGFYNQRLFFSPYPFDAGPVNMEEIRLSAGMIHAGSRTVRHADGSLHQHAVYLRFLGFSQTDYEAALVEGDIPDTIQLMGRTFKGNLKRERHRLEEGTSPLPTLLEKVQAWQLNRQQVTTPDCKLFEQQFAKVVLNMAKEQPELVGLRNVTADQCLIREGAVSEHVYLVLSGQLSIYRCDQHLCDQDGVPLVVAGGGILGELSVLRGGVASATVRGDAVVLSLSKTVVEQQLVSNPVFRRSMEQLASYHSF